MGEKWDSSDETRRARYRSKGTGPMEKQRARDGAAPEQHGISTGAGRLVEKVLVFQISQTKINPIMPCDTGRLATNGVA